jgi:hypothetical protein
LPWTASQRDALISTIGASGRSSAISGESGAGEFRHRLIGQDDIEALRRFAECP